MGCLINSGYLGYPPPQTPVLYEMRTLRILLAVLISILLTVAPSGVTAQQNVCMLPPYAGALILAYLILSLTR